jgi:ABC-type spermidine/putrescine transport system permease subunit I
MSGVTPPGPGRREWLLAHGGRVLLAAPSFGWTLLFFLVPLGILLVYSFGQVDVITLQLRFGWTLENYERIGDALYLRAVLRSLTLSTVATVACLIIGFPVAYFISLQSPRTQRLLLLLIIVPFWTSFLVRIYAWTTILQDGGIVERAGRSLGLLDGPLHVLYTPTAVGIGIVYGYLPLMVLPIYVALERIDPALKEAAADLGAGGWRVFRRVIWPLSVPGVIGGCILVGIPATGEYVVPAILGGGKTLMYGNVVSSQFLEAGDYPFGSALAVALMAVLTVALLIARSRMARREEVT